MKKNQKELLFITVIGFDKKGIVAQVSNLLFLDNVNIEDISQKVIEGYFVMNMLVDMKDSKVSLEVIREKLNTLAKKLGLHIQIQHENVFKMMHRV